jgi:hypothetical protein
VPRGTGSGVGASAPGGGQKTTSGSGYVGNSSGSDVKNATLQEAEDTKNQHMIEALEETPTNQVDMINTTVLKIYELLEGVTKGNQTLRVRVENYGLTGTSTTGAQGGVAGLNNSGNVGSSSFSGDTGYSGSGGYGISSGTAASGSGVAIDLGGWTMM